MTKITIRQSRPRGSGVLIGVAVLVIYAFMRTGPFLGPVQDAPGDRQPVQRIMEHTSKEDEDMERFGKSLEESGAVEQSLENIRRFVEERRKAREAEIPNPEAANE